MVQPPWDKIIKQLRVNHLSVIGINDPEHHYNKLEGKRNPLFKIHQLSTTYNLLIIYCSKNLIVFVIYNERQISKPANDQKDSSNFRPLVVMVGGPPSSLISQLCFLRQRDLSEVERNDLSVVCNSSLPGIIGLVWFLSRGFKSSLVVLDPIPHSTELAHIQESVVDVPFPWTHHVV